MRLLVTNHQFRGSRSSRAAALTIIMRPARLRGLHVEGDERQALPKSSRCFRNDDMGGFQMKYTDNGGAEWSRERWAVPLRSAVIDRKNTYCGSVQLIYSGARSLLAGG